MPVATYRVSILGRAKGTPSAVGVASYGAGKVMRIGAALAAASYLAGEAMRDQEQGRVYDYSSRDDVRHHEVLAPAHAPDWARSSETLWGEVERRENRSNSQLARTIIIGLPRQLTLEQNIDLMREHLQEQYVSKGMCADFAIHEIKAADGDNQPHAHVMLTLRGFNEDGTWQKNKNREWNGYNQDKEWDAKGNPIATNRRFEAADMWRDAWKKTQNAHLEKAGSDARVSMKSYADRGIDKKPQIHLGPNLAEMEQKGIQTDKGNYNRWAAQRNKVVEAVKGLLQRLVRPDKAQQHKREYTVEDIKAYYAKMEAAQDHVYEPKPEDMKKEESRRQEQKQEQTKAEWKQEPRREAQADTRKPPETRPRRVASPEDRDHYNTMRPFLQNHPWDSRQDMLHFIAVTSKYMHQKKAEARRDPFERLAGTRDSQRFRAVWQDRPIPKQGRERSRGDVSDNVTEAQPDDNVEGDVFQRRLRRDALASSAAEGAASNVYLPYGLAIEGRDEEGLTFYHADGVITVKFYVHLTDIICTTPQYLTLIYMDCVYTLQGRNLYELIPLIKRHKLDGVQCFDAAEYAVPLKGPVIYSITRESHAEMAG